MGYIKTIPLGFILPAQPIMLWTYKSCTHSTQSNGNALVKRIKVDFLNMLQNKRLFEAFTYYTNSMAVIQRLKYSPIKDRKAIEHCYTNSTHSSTTTVWETGFSDASSDGNMAYTIGNSQGKAPWGHGNTPTVKGIFQCVWKLNAIEA